LKVDDFINPILHEYVVTSLYSITKPKIQQKAAYPAEWDIGVSAPTQDLF